MELQITGEQSLSTANASPTATPQTAEELPNFLDTFQSFLYNNQGQPQTTVPSVMQMLGQNEYAVSEQFVGQSLNQITKALNLGRGDLIGQSLGIDPNQTLTAEQRFKITDSAGGGRDLKDPGSAEFQAFQKAFTNQISTPGAAAKPQPINRLEAFAFLQDSFKVDDMMQGLNFLKAEQRELEAQLRMTITDERGKPVPQSVISGRINKQQQLARENLEFNQRQQMFLSDQVNTANNTISLYMNFAEMDYQDAKERYNTEFAQNLEIAKFTHAIETDKRDFEAQQRQLEVQNSQATLATYANAITSGNLNFSDLSADQQLQLGQLEARAGLPQGFISNLQMSPGDRILGMSSDKTQAWVIGKDGQMQVINTGLRKAGGGGSSTGGVSNALIAEANTFLNQGKTFEQLVEAFANSVGSVGDLYSLYRQTEKGKASGVPEEDPIATRSRFNEIAGKGEPSSAFESDLGGMAAAIKKDPENEDEWVSRMIQTYPTMVEEIEAVKNAL